MFSLHPFDEEEEPTVREMPSGAFIVAADRGARKLAAAIELLESGADPEDLLETLKEAHALVNGRPAK
ncbi:MAG: hypothetical protein WBY94_28305 [Polyangiaceae bacterium]